MRRQCCDDHREAFGLEVNAMAVIGVSSIIFSAGLLLAFLVGPRADIAAVVDAGRVLMALGFAGLFAALLFGSKGPPPPRYPGGPRPRDHRPRLS